MGNQQSNRTQTYQQYYDAMRQNQPIELPADVSPYDILGVSRDFTWEELKEAYKRQARLVHPDKGGTEQLFNMVTEAFKKLAYEFKLKQQDKSHYELKQNFKMEQPVQNKKRPTWPDKQPTVSNEGFQDKFNRMFDDNKFEDEETDRGYGHMMTESSKTREEIDIPKVMNKFNNNKFHEIFEKNTPLGKDVIIYKEPEPLVLAKRLNFTEIGGTVDDYSTDATKKTGLHYTDYMKAHTTTRLVDPRTITERKEYKSVDDYESDRAAITNRLLTPAEIADQKKSALKKEKEEEQRIKRTQYRDERIEKHFNNVSQLFIQ